MKTILKPEQIMQDVIVHNGKKCARYIGSEVELLVVYVGDTAKVVHAESIEFNDETEQWGGVGMNAKQAIADFGHALVLNPLTEKMAKLVA